MASSTQPTAPETETETGTNQVQATVVIAGAGLSHGEILTVASDDRRIGKTIVVTGDAPIPDIEDDSSAEFDELKTQVGGGTTTVDGGGFQGATSGSAGVNTGAPAPDTKGATSGTSTDKAPSSGN